MKKIKNRIIFFFSVFITSYNVFSQVCPGGNATGNLNPVVGNTYTYCFQCPSCSSQSGCLFMSGLNAGEQIVVNGTLYTGPLNYGNTGQVCIVGGAWSCFSIQFLTTATNLDLLWETDSGCPVAGYFVNYNNINSTPCSTPSVTTTSTTICSGQSGTITATGTPAGGTYSWSNGGGTSSSMTASPAVTTTYTVTYTVTGGCTQTATATINVNPVSTLTVNSPTVCLGNSTTLTATPGTPGGTYSWTPLGGTSSSVSISPISSFSYTVTYTAPNGCTTTAVGNVTVIPSPSVSVNSATICSGSSATLNATTVSVGGSYSWAPGGATTPSITVNPTSTTTYTVTYTAVNGCTKTATGTVTVNPTPTLTVNSATVCLGNSATLTANPSIPGGTYSWTPMGGTSSSVSISPISNFSFTVTYTSPAGCTATATGTVTVIPSPTASVNSVNICNGQFATLNATVSPLGGTYSWNPGGATSSSITVNPSSTTTYTVTYTSSNGCTKTATGVVTIKPDPTLSVNNDTICNGGTATLTATASPLGGVYSWSNGGGSGSSMTANPTTTTTYTVTYTSPNGCTKTATGTITVASATLTVSSATICGTNGPATITATPNPGGGTFLWNPGGGTGSSLTDNPAVTTTYTVSYTSLSGCTVTATGTINVVPTPTLIVNPVTICTGQSATLSANTSPSGGTYLWSPGGSNSSNISVNPTTTTTYTVLYTAPNGCTNSTTATVTVNPNPAVTVNSATICLGQSATLMANGATNYFWSSGGTNNIETVAPITTSTYTVTGISTGCSSTALSTVIVKANLSGTINQSICQGNAITFNGNVLSTSGTYYDTILSVDGCDSTLILNLTVNPPLAGTVNQSICQGNSITFNGQILTTSGVYKDTVQNGSGCDSIITLNLTVAPITNSINQSICQGNSIVFNGQTLTASGTYKDTLQTALGCDSIVTLNLTINPPLNGSITQSICQGNSIVFNNQTLTVSGVYKDTVQNGSGCDSIITLNLSVAPITNSISQTICQGNNVVFNSQTLTTSGIYKDTLQTALGCDSIITLNLTVNSALTGSINHTICQGNSYLFNNQTLTTSGVYKDTVQNVSGCDSIITLNLTVNAILASTINQSICQGNSYTFNGQNLTNTGVYYDTVLSSLGCDSIITLNLTVNNLSYDTLNQNICIGASYFFNGQNLTNSGVYKDTLINNFGCDSLVVLNLTVNNIVTASINQTICQGNSFLFNNQNLTNPGIYKDTLVSVYGCDSILMLTLIVNAPLTGTLNQTICSGNSYLFNAQNITTTGTYLDTLINSNGCDSILTLNLTVAAPLTGSYNYTICKGNSYLFNGQNLTTTGTYLDTLKNSNNCDSIVTLNLTVSPPLTGSINKTICIGNSFLFNNQNLSNAGTYYDTLSNAGGCDSIVTLNLLVVPFFTGSFNQTICVGTTYLFNGQNISTTGSYKDTLITPAGCDSIVTLNLTVANYITIGLAQTICTGDTYNFNGQTISYTGTYVDTITSASACDTIVTLNLIVLPIATNSISHTICEGSSYLFNGQYLTTTGIYKDTLVTSKGCDSILSLILVVNPSPISAISSDITINIGESATLMVSGTGTYNWYPSTGLSATTGSPVVATPTVTTVYCVVMNNGSNCIDTACITVTVIDNCPINAKILSTPTAFSPNGDGVNEEYCLQGWEKCAKEFVFIVYNRWGQEIFKSENPEFCWDGTYLGKAQDAQVFTYFVRARFTSFEEPVVKSGNISMIK